jgi:hypothetical protein
VDSRIAPETCGPLYRQKSIREQALAAHSSGISHGSDEGCPDFHGLTGAGVAFEAFLTAACPATLAIKRFSRANETTHFREQLWPYMRSSRDSQ